MKYNPDIYYQIFSPRGNPVFTVIGIENMPARLENAIIQEHLYGSGELMQLSDNTVTHYDLYRLYVNGALNKLPNIGVGTLKQVREFIQTLGN